MSFAAGSKCLGVTLPAAQEELLGWSRAGAATHRGAERTSSWLMRMQSRRTGLRCRYPALLHWQQQWRTLLAQGRAEASSPASASRCGMATPGRVMSRQVLLSQQQVWLLLRLLTLQRVQHRQFASKWASACRWVLRAQKRQQQ